MGIEEVRTDLQMLRETSSSAQKQTNMVQKEQKAINDRLAEFREGLFE